MNLELNTEFGQTPDASAFELDLRDHQICQNVAAGAKLDVIRMDLPGGIVIAGALRGRVHCASGSAVILEGGEFQGELVAVNIIVAAGGKITSPLEDGKIKSSNMSSINARGQVDINGKTTGGVISLAAGSNVCAKLSALAWDIRRNAVINNSILITTDA